MEIKFFDDPFESPKPRHEVRIKQLGLYIYPDQRRVAVGFELTPFLEKPSIEVKVVNAEGVSAGSMNVIEAFQTNFSLTMHLRDKAPTSPYHLRAILYYATPETEREDVHVLQATFSVDEEGEHIFTYDEEE
ncbi:MAG TPA: hypothetical protein VLL52_11550 [Anaerolineae bacterium]|nr:hypothetical protein [Anaerolineae bacterium]